MKVTAILGSPRKSGVTSTLATTFIGDAENKGADTNVYQLDSMDYKGCLGCNVCKTKKDHCILKDDLTQVLEDLKTSDIIVFGTPIYFWDVSGQFKLFFDRTWSLVKPDYKTNPDPVRITKGKKALLITSQGDVEEKHRDVSERYSSFLTMFGYQTQTLRATGMSMDSVPDISGYVEEIHQLAESMIP